MTLSRTQSFNKYGDEKEIPCDFLRYVANEVYDDLEQFKFQLDANHTDNFPAEQVTLK